MIEILDVVWFLNTIQEFTMSIKHAELNQEQIDEASQTLWSCIGFN